MTFEVGEVLFIVLDLKRRLLVSGKCSSESFPEKLLFICIVQRLLLIRILFAFTNQINLKCFEEIKSYTENPEIKLRKGSLLF